MRNIFVFLLVISFIGCKKNEPTPIINNSWIEDIEYIQNELPTKHINLFSIITEQEFNSEIQSLIKNVPELAENEIILELMKIFAMIGDSHTGLHNESNLAKFTNAPIIFEIFDDGIYIVSIIESGQAFLKQKVVAIDNVPIDIICEKIRVIIPHENEYYVKSVIPYILRLYEILEALDIIDNKNSYDIMLENGENFQVKGATSPTDNFISCYEPDKTPLYQLNNDSNYWYKVLENNIVYFQYNKCFDMPANTFLNVTQTMFQELENQVIDKFIIDIRLNRGGSALIISPLIEELKKHDDLNGKIYCCISCQTISSGLFAAFDLKEQLGAILVGEPTGGKPNHFGEVQELILPNTQLMVRYSTKYFTLYPDKNINTLEPDYFVENKSFDSFVGIDSYIEFIKLN